MDYSNKYFQKLKLKAFCDVDGSYNKFKISGI